MPALDALRAQAVLAEYLASLRYKDSTIRTKTAYLMPFLSFAAGAGIADLREVSAAQIQRYLESQANALCARTRRPYSPGTLLLFHNAVKFLFTALYQAELLLSNPVREISFRPREKNRLRAVFNEEEIARFLDGIDVHQKLGLRDRSMFELMYSSGLRAGELGKLDRGDIDLGERMLIVRDAKWSKDRVVPMSEVARSFLAMYLTATGEPSKPAFIGLRGRIGAGCVAKRFRFHLKNAGLQGKGLSAHSIRHATATHLLAHGADLRYVQELLGHESIETTVIYTNELFENLKRIYRRYHPRENELYREVDEDYRARVGRLLARLEDPRRLALKARRQAKRSS
jgi:integrase/recombinase XerD